jgi:hypothetical protein
MKSTWIAKLSCRECNIAGSSKNQPDVKTWLSIIIRIPHQALKLWLAPHIITTSLTPALMVDHTIQVIYFQASIQVIYFQAG